MYAGKEKSTMRHASATEVKEFDKRRMPSCKPFVRRHLFPYPTVNCYENQIKSKTVWLSTKIKTPLKQDYTVP